MNPNDPKKNADRSTRNDPTRDNREQRERTVAPPIEREHETQAGVLEEDERREKERK